MDAEMQMGVFLPALKIILEQIDLLVPWDIRIKKTRLAFLFFLTLILLTWRIG
jgi:hypothetical protein